MKEIKYKERAFTLSEVIITLVILGIVAAITVPMMSNSASDKKWNVARQKAQATIGEAFRLMTVNGEISTKNSDGTTRTTEYMVTKVLPKYLKLEKTCAPAKYGDCGFSSKNKSVSGSNMRYTPNNWTWEKVTNSLVWNYSPTVKSDTAYTKYMTYFITKYGQTYNTNYFFRTLDGFSVAFLYNPYCAAGYNDHYVLFIDSGNYYQTTLDRICLMGIYDMNGKAGPNQTGKDIGFVGSFYNGFETKTTAVLPSNFTANGTSISHEKALNYCKNLKEKGEWKLPDINELSLIHLNYELVANGQFDHKQYWSSNPIGSSSSYRIINFFSNDTVTAWASKDYNGSYVRCVRANALK